MKNGRSKCRRERERERDARRSWGKNKRTCLLGRIGAGVSTVSVVLLVFVSVSVWLGLARHACLLGSECVCLSVVAVLYCAVVWCGWGRNGLCWDDGGALQVRTWGIALRTTRSLLARLLHAHILLANPNSCDAFHCLQRIHNGEGGEMKIPIFVCMSVCRFDVLLGGGGVGQEMVFEEWKEQV